MTGPLSGRITLNADQERALTRMDDGGPLRVIAGPGTSKTTTSTAWSSSSCR
jgi:superfamily I DNA/RNA helicase